jgi:hypothetical protein
MYSIKPTRNKTCVGLKIFTLKRPSSDIRLKYLSVEGKKGKFRPTTGHECQKGEYSCSSTLSLTSALGEVGG